MLLHNTSQTICGCLAFGNIRPKVNHPIHTMASWEKEKSNGNMPVRIWSQSFIPRKLQIIVRWQVS
jgi:hypothetical protein